MSKQPLTPWNGTDAVKPADPKYVPFSGTYSPEKGHQSQKPAATVENPGEFVGGYWDEDGGLTRDDEK
jgi:hypothetical protein